MWLYFAAFLCRDSKHPLRARGCALVVRPRPASARNARPPLTPRRPPSERRVGRCRMTPPPSPRQDIGLYLAGRSCGRKSGSEWCRGTAWVWRRRTCRPTEARCTSVSSSTRDDGWRIVTHDSVVAASACRYSNERKLLKVLVVGNG